MVRRFFKRLIWKFKIRMRNKLDYKPIFKKNSNEERVIKITEMLLRKSNSELSMTPISSKYYIKYKNIFVVIKDNSINLINGKYNYDIFVSDKVHSYICKKFRKSLETRVNKIEEEISSKVHNILDNIYEDITKDSK